MQVRAILLGSLLTVACGLASTTAHADSISFVRGDVNGDGVIGMDDVIAAQDYWFQLGTVPVLEALDANDDGRFTSADANIMLEVVYGQARPPRPEAICFVLGDLDGNGALTANDAHLLAAYLRGHPSDAPLDALDVATDGVINDADLRALTRMIAVSGRGEQRGRQEGVGETPEQPIDGETPETGTGGRPKVKSKPADDADTETDDEITKRKKKMRRSQEENSTDR